MDILFLLVVWWILFHLNREVVSMKIRDLIETLVRLEKDYGNLPITPFDFRVMNDKIIETTKQGEEE